MKYQIEISGSKPLRMGFNTLPKVQEFLEKSSGGFTSIVKGRVEIFFGPNPAAVAEEIALYREQLRKEI